MTNNDCLPKWMGLIIFFLRDLLPELAQDPEIVRESIRFMTFTRMKLRHTCCYAPHGDSLLQDMDKEEVNEIRDEERELLAQLEELVAEFEEKYDGLGQPLVTFLEGYWMTRMEEVLSQEGEPGEDEIRRVRAGRGSC